MIPVADALARVLALCAPLDTEDVALSQAAGRVLRAPVTAARDQPPFAAAAMDGYAVAGPVAVGDSYQVVGEAAAGHAHAGSIGPGQALRIFTGAPVPGGADTVVIQENVQRAGDTITVTAPGRGANIRARGGDFAVGDTVNAPRQLRAVDLALIAAMNHARVTVTRRPDVAIIATGDELVMPGAEPRADQIIASNAFALQAMAAAEGASARLLPIAADSEASLRAVFDLAAGADLIVTIGGASVGDHDLVGPVADALGAERNVYKVALRPGKPLMAGRMGGAALLGLPGNPVSAIVCGHLFLRPALRAMAGLGKAALPTRTAALAAALDANGPRAHYMRATLGADGTITALPSQDSAMLSLMARADALLVRPPDDPPRAAGEQMQYLALDRGMEQH